MLNKILNFLFPAQCSWCKEYWAFFCKKCINKLKKRIKIEVKTINLHKIYAIYEYYSNKKLQKLIKDIKYNSLFSKIPEVSEVLSKILLEKFPNQDLFLVPVPLHWIRNFKRWFNQSELIINSILKNVNSSTSSEWQECWQIKNFCVTFCHSREGRNPGKIKSWQTKNLLKRIKNTPHQASLDKKWRLLNLQNAFKINNFEKIDSSIPIILIDDICTTWETLENCAIELRKYYKNPIYWLVIASDKI